MGGSCVKLTITPIPVDRPPLPLPNGVKGPIYFTIQPGGPYVNVIGSSHARSARSADGDIHRNATSGSASHLAGCSPAIARVGKGLSI